MPGGVSLNRKAQIQIVHSLSHDGRSAKGSWILQNFGWQLNSSQGLLAEAMVSQLFQVGTAAGGILYQFQTNAQEESKGKTAEIEAREGPLKDHSCFIPL